MKPNRFITLATACLVTAAIPIVAHSAYSSDMPTVSQIAQAQSVTVAAGTFVAAEKPTAGTARIISESGRRYLELDAAFSTSEQGPDLHVLLDPSAQPPKSYSSSTGVVNLGKLTSYSGSQRYAIPDSVQISDFNSVVIWCQTANATFGYAPLQPAQNALIR